MRPHHNAIVSILMLLVLLAAGCAGVEAVRRDYQHVMTFPGADATGDHLLLVTPSETLEALLAASLAKILIVTDEPGRESIRHAILRGNAERLLAA